MILPIYAYGHPVLKRVGENITDKYEDLDALIENMWETMYQAKGVGLAAPQIGLSIRLFIVDTYQIQEKGKEDQGIKKVFINAQILEEEGDDWSYEEGCLSIPEIRGDVTRPSTLRIRYQDEQFVEHIDTFSGINARVIQHEYDHIDGILFIELLKPIKRRLIKNKLESIRKGRIEPDYKMKFYIK